MSRDHISGMSIGTLCAPKNRLKNKRWPGLLFIYLFSCRMLELWKSIHQLSIPVYLFIFTLGSCWSAHSPWWKAWVHPGQVPSARPLKFFEAHFTIDFKKMCYKVWFSVVHTAPEDFRPVIVFTMLIHYIAVCRLSFLHSSLKVPLKPFS